MRHFSIIAFIIFTILPQANGQKTVRGNVVDCLTKQPIAFANIIYPHQLGGTISNLDGSFSLDGRLETDSVLITCLGYKSITTTKYLLERNRTICLSPETIALSEVTVKPENNQAIDIIKKAIQNIPLNNPDASLNYECNIYNKMTFRFDLPENASTPDSNVQDSNQNINIKDLLLIESVATKRHRAPDETNESVIYGRVSGFENPALSVIPSQLQPFSFYQKTLKILDTEYLNPLSKDGLDYYNYLLEDTIATLNADTLYYISFSPKPSANIQAITGSFHISSNGYALKTVSAHSSETDAQISLSIKQKYNQVDGHWFPIEMESELILMPNSLKTKTIYPLIGKGKSYVSAIVFNPTFKKDAFSEITFKDETQKSTNSDIKTYRYVPLTAKDSLTYRYIDSIGRANRYDKLLELQKSLAEGYIAIGILDMDIRKIIGYNSFEGLKLGMGLWTNDKVSKLYSLGGYSTYGFSQNRIGYGGGIKLNLKPSHETTLMALYKNDFEGSGNIVFHEGFEKKSLESLKNNLFECMALKTSIEGSLSTRMLKYFKLSAWVNQSKTNPFNAFPFQRGSEIENNYELTKIGIKLKWQNKETISQTYLGTFPNPSKWPKVWLNLSTGKGSTYNFSGIETQVQQSFYFKPSQESKYRIVAGNRWGNMPDGELYSYFGSYRLPGIDVPFTFNTMRTNEFAMNRFTAIFLSHNIPLRINREGKFKPELLFSSSAIWGDAFQSNISSIPKGYYESGVNLNNIFTQFIFKYGIGVFYRYGAYAFEKPIDNLSIKLALQLEFK